MAIRSTGEGRQPFNLNPKLAATQIGDQPLDGGPGPEGLAARGKNAVDVLLPGSINPKRFERVKVPRPPGRHQHGAEVLKGLVDLAVQVTDKLRRLTTNRREHALGGVCRDIYQACSRVLTFDLEKYPEGIEE